jgi:hypothetical protein
MNNLFRSGKILGLGFFAACFSGMPTRAAAGVYDDCTAWYHFDYAPNYTPGASNVVAISEIRDQRNWGTAATKGTGGYHATGLVGPLGGPQWTNAPVEAVGNCAGGGKYGNLSVRFEPLTNGLGQTYPPAIQVSNLQLPGSSTIIARFLWDGFMTTDPAWFFNNNLDWTYKRGWMLGVRSYTSVGRLSMYVGQTEIYLDTYAVTTGKWYDAAAVLTDNGPSNTDTVELYLWPNEPNGKLYYKKTFTSAVTNSIPTSGAIIGAEPYQNGYSYSTNSNSGKCFKGMINHLAVWNRALSYTEVTEAFGYPHNRFQIGLNNNSLNDLGPETETDAEYYPNDPWYTMRREVTAVNPEATLKITFTNDQAKLNYAFHVKTLTDGQAGNLALIVNSVTNPSQTAGNAKDLFWFITTNMLFKGTNTFTLQYKSGPASYIGFDWLELAGSWQVGFENNSTAEFSQEGVNNLPAHFYVTEPTWTNVYRAVTFATTNTFVHFTLSSELKQKCRFTYTTRIIGQGGFNAQDLYPFSININNRLIKSYAAVQNGTYISIPLTRDQLVSGENVIQLMYNGPLVYSSGGGWLQFDFHRMNMSPWPAGTFLRLQ